MLNDMGKYYDRLPGQGTVNEIGLRLKYGIPSKYLELVLLPGIGAVKANQLINNHKIFSCQDYVSAIRMGKKLFSEDLIKKTLPIAQEIAREGKANYLKKMKHK
jgi:replicative superfamily II helicase